MQKGKLKITGMETQKDADNVLTAINNVWGVRAAEVNFTSREALISFNEEAASYNDFEQAVKDSGYGVVTENSRIEKG